MPLENQRRDNILPTPFDMKTRERAFFGEEYTTSRFNPTF